MSNGNGAVCGRAVGRRTVTDFFMNPCLRTADLFSPQGEIQKGSDGAFVQFAVSIDPMGNFLKIKYRSTSCATLVAYAELAGERLMARAAVEAFRIDPPTLIDWLPGVPEYKHGRAKLVLQALWSAVARTLESPLVTKVELSFL